MQLFNFIHLGVSEENYKAYLFMVEMWAMGFSVNEIQETTRECGFHVTTEQIEYLGKILDIQLDLDLGAKDDCANTRRPISKATN